MVTGGGEAEVERESLHEFTTNFTETARIPFAAGTRARIGEALCMTRQSAWERFSGEE